MGVRGGSPQDERPKGWVEKGTRLILKRGHVSRSQSNTLAEVKRSSGSGRTSAFVPIGQSQCTLCTGSWDPRDEDAWAARDRREKRNFEVRCPPVMIRHAECARWRNFTG